MAVLLLGYSAQAQETPGCSTLEIRTTGLSGDEVSSEAFLDGRRLGITPYLDEVSPGRYRLEVKAAEGEWWGRVTVDDDEAEVVDVTVMPFPVFRIALSGAGGILLHAREFYRSHFNVGAEFGVRLGPFVINLGAFGFAEEPYHVFVRPGMQWYPFDDWLYVRGGVPMRVLEGFDVGATLGPGVRLGRRHVAFFAEMTGTMFLKPGTRTLPVEGRLGMEVLF